VDNNISVSKTGGGTPTIVNIGFGGETDSWLVYNPDDSDAVPSILYRVRFIGKGGWTGVGETGHVVGGDIYDKKTNRVDW
jgi:hypothetical protein